MKTTIKTFVVVLAVIIFSACASSPNAPQENTTQEDNTNTTSNKGQAFIEDEGATPNALQIAIGSNDHTTLVAAVQATGLENTLVNAGPLTVFAPTNAAFESLPAGTLENLLKPENKDVLANILKYHVTPGNLSKDFLAKFKKLGQANGEDVMIEIKDGETYVGGAKIIASIPASNGIVHVLDKVLIPGSK